MREHYMIYSSIQKFKVHTNLKKKKKSISEKKKCGNRLFNKLALLVLDLEFIFKKFRNFEFFALSFCNL